MNLVKTQGNGLPLKPEVDIKNRHAKPRLPHPPVIIVIIPLKTQEDGIPAISPGFPHVFDSEDHSLNNSLPS